MNWTSIRLELARTQDFPNGSAARSYMLRLPLRRDGRVDETLYRHSPEMATVRRFWPNEPDQYGYLARTQAGWAFSRTPGAAGGELLFNLDNDNDAIRPGGCLTLTEPDGNSRPYEIKTCRRT
ncbi:hypothetical protein BH10PSE12_BH10PSE12_32320 [soil metagenome]